MKRRDFLKRAGIGVAASAAFGPVFAQGSPTVRWRMASSFPKSLDTIYGAAEVLADRVSALTGGRFQIRVYQAGEIVPGLQVLDAVQQGLFDKAKRNLDENTYACATLEEVKEKMASQGGFAKTMWCGELACELKMKEEAGVSSRCIPLEQEHLGDTCACCGKPAKHMVYWGVAY